MASNKINWHQMRRYRIVKSPKKKLLRCDDERFVRSLVGYLCNKMLRLEKVHEPKFTSEQCVDFMISLGI